MTVPFHLAPERPGDAPLVESLIARALGPGRFAKTAERLREGSRPIAELSFVAWRGGVAVGCVRLWPIDIEGRAALLLGPLAVEAALRGDGIGRALVARACEAAAEAGHALVLLVGDESYYGPLGFSAAPAQLARLPGPVNQGRVLVRPLIAGVERGLAGTVSISAEREQQARGVLDAA